MHTNNIPAKTRRKFADVLANVHFDEIAPLLQGIRAQRESRSYTCTVVNPPFNGFYNLVWRVEFSDGVSWAIKIPRRGYQGEWSELAAHSMTTEARVMQLLKRDTTIPVPDLFVYDASVDNALGCPFIVMEWTSGVSLDNYWDVNAPFPERLNMHQKIQVLQDLAAAVVQLDKFRFEACGMPLFDDQGKVTAVGPALFTDCAEDSGHPPLLDAGPFEKCQHFLNWKIDRFAENTSDFFEKDFAASFRSFTTWMQEETKQPESFVLAHRDLGPQNILINEHGRMCGIIDWEMAAILPECLGNGKNGSYPHWLTRDYDMYRGHGSSASTANTEVVEPALFDAEEELLRLDPLQDYLEDISSARDTLIAAPDETEDIDTEELEFYRNVWRVCVEQASLHASSDVQQIGAPLSVDNILELVPRTYATGLTPALSLDGRILMKAAEYPHQNLATVVNSIKRQIAKVKLSHDLSSYEEDEEPQEKSNVQFVEAVQCAYAENGLPAMAVTVSAAGGTDVRTLPADSSHAVVPEYMSPPYTLGENVNVPILPQPKATTPPQSLPTTTDAPFTLDGSTIGTDMTSFASSASSPGLIAAQDVADVGIFHMSDCPSAPATEQGDITGLEAIAALDGEQEIDDERRKREQELEMKPWFLYLYAGISPFASRSRGVSAV